MRMAGRRGRGDTGASAVEFAIVLPVLLLLTIGMLEFAFVMRDNLSVASATRVGARTASTGANAGPGTCPGPPITCVPAAVPALAQNAADAIQQSGSAMPQDFVDYILVYKANNKGFPGPSGSTTMPSMAGCGTGVYTDCVAFRWAKIANRFVYVGGSWDSTTINACSAQAPGDPGPDSVGVYMHATHPYFTKLFGANLGIDNRAVLRFEPLPINECAPGRHQ